jgi:putative DNA primase/helicase
MQNPYNDDFDPNEPDVFGDFDYDMKEEKEQEKTKCYRRPQIHVSGGKLHENVDMAEQYLLSSGIEIYQRDGRIVRVGTVPIKGQIPTLQFIEVGKENLIETLTSIITFMKHDARGKKGSQEKVVNCPTDIAATYLDRVGKWQLPVIRAIINAPTLREDGSMLDQPGYDERTGIYL